jgi:DNA-binding NarL/FixJ family response regulator
MKIRVAVADDHPVVREGLLAMLDTEGDFVVAGEAGTGPEALALIASADPDVLLLDLELPGVDGVGVLRRLQSDGARTRVIVFTVFDTDERIIAALEAGAAGYLLKGTPREELFEAIRAVARGESLLAPVATSAVLRRVRGESDPTPALTAREQAVLEQLARGLGNKQIAAALGIAERTVKFHVSSVFAKLGASNRTEAVTRAVQAGLIEL